jgi:hypothetical protein
MTSRRIRRPAHPFRAALIAAALLAALILAACSRLPLARVTPAAPPTPGVLEDLPETNASKVISEVDGGKVALRDGAEIAIPPNALSETSVVSLKLAASPPRAPIPRSLIGRAYEFGMDGGSLTGIARIRLPLPAAITLDQYDIGVYRWNGQVWERILGRVAGNAMEFGTNIPGGVFAVQGQWRQADASLGLALTTAAEPGRGAMGGRLAASGEYRYMTLPMLQNELVSARLTWKLDTSGGMGQISGNDTLDKTVGETALWFKPDPVQAQGVIEFSQPFDLAPGAVDIQPGMTRYIYAVLTVEDSPAPTRRVSKAIEYTQILPIRIVGAEVVRPALAREPPAGLRWHVRFNGLSMAQRAAVTTTLPLAEFLALGGLGDYSVILEAPVDGKVIAISNEVQIKLALPGTPTATPTSPPPPATLTAIATSPRVGTPTPGAAPPPATPTPRAPPGARTATSTPSPTATAEASTTATPTRPAWASVFWADRYSLTPGECTTLHWKLQGVTAVYLNDVAVTGAEDRRECPSQTTIYTLRVISGTGTQDLRLSITVQAGATPDVQFSANSFTLIKGQCTNLTWQTSDVIAVFLNDAGVPGVATKEVCPETTSVYTLRVDRAVGASTTKSLTIKVLPVEGILLHFWAEQYALEPGKCTNLHWSVQDVDAVYLQKPGGEVGVAGVGIEEACPPTRSQVYTLRAEASNDRKASKKVLINTFDPAAPGLAANEVIAQGIVNSVNNVLDADPNAAGDQPGYHLSIDGITPLFKGTGPCCQTAITFKITQTQTDDSMAEVVDWPVNPGQFVEFRGDCTADTCTLPANLTFYFKLRSN